MLKLLRTNCTWSRYNHLKSLYPVHLECPTRLPLRSCRALSSSSRLDQHFLGKAVTKPLDPSGVLGDEFKEVEDKKFALVHASDNFLKNISSDCTRAHSADEWTFLAKKAMEDIDIKYFHKRLERIWPTMLLHQLLTKFMESRPISPLQTSNDLTEVHECIMSLILYIKQTNGGNSVTLLCPEALVLALTPSGCLEGDVLEITEKVKSMTDVLDSTNMLFLVTAISYTSEWRTGLDLISNLLPQELLRSFHYSPLFSKAAYEKDWTIFHAVAGLICDMHTMPTQSALREVIELAHSQPQAMAHLLQCLRNNHWLVDRGTAEKMKDWFISSKDTKWTGELIAIEPTGLCRACGQQLEEIVQLKPSDFDSLRSAILESCLKRNGVFFNTTPRELSSFFRFLDDKAPFDVVIDGLNAAFIDKSTRDFQLLSVVEHFFEQKKKVLVLGRKHMLGWSCMADLLKISQIFLLSNISQDDPFILYAAVHSGYNTIIVTKDELGNHRSFLHDIPLQRLFARWQRTRQYLYLGSMEHPETGEVIVKIVKPEEMETCVQQKDRGWHIPFKEVVPSTGESYNRWTAKFRLTTTWLCMQPEGARASEQTFSILQPW